MHWLTRQLPLLQAPTYNGWLHSPLWLLSGACTGALVPLQPGVVAQAGAAQGDGRNGGVAPQAEGKAGGQAASVQMGQSQECPQPTFKEKLPVAYLC